MSFKSKNMNYIFNVSYFEDLDWDAVAADHAQTNNEMLLKEHNRAIEEFCFEGVSPSDAWKMLDGYRKFDLYTRYPGLLTGIGNIHSLKINGAIKCGFCFDYTTGLPYIPGSSLKGALRACFPGDGRPQNISEEYGEYIKGVLGREDIDAEELKNQIFEGRDMFLGAFPVLESGGSKLMQMEFITPHTAGQFKNPKPIGQIKVRPNVEFEFGFILTDYVPEDGRQPVTAEQKLTLFKTLILDMGIGAKTHIGFGRFSEKRTPQAEGQGQRTAALHHAYKEHQQNNNHDGGAPKCKTPGCNNRVKKSLKTGKWYPYCPVCSQKRKF